MDPELVFTAYDLQGATPSRGLCPSCGRGELTQFEHTHHRVCGHCGFMSYVNPMPAVSIIVKNATQFVLCRRRSSTIGTGQWALPGGYVEFDEDFLTAARREVHEESGLEVAIGEIVRVVSNFHRPNLHSLVVVLTAQPIAGTLQPEAEDILEARWHRFGVRLPSMAFAGDEHLIERYFGTGISGAPVDPRFAG